MNDDALTNTPVEHVADIKIGAIDGRGFEITDVFWKTKDYAVFKVRGRVSPMFSDNAADSETQRKNYMQLGEALARINSLEPGRLDRFWRWLHHVLDRPGADEPVPSGHKYLDQVVARAIVMSFEGLLDDAKNTLALVEQKITNTRQNQYRVVYLLAAAFVAAVYVGLILRYVQPGACDIVDADCGPVLRFMVDEILLFRATAVAALAGVLSISLNVRTLEFDIDSRGYMTFIYGVMRLGISVIAAVFVYLALQSKIIFATLNLTLSGADPSQNAALYVFAFLAGFSESFVPNVLERVQSEQTPPENGG